MTVYNSEEVYKVIALTLNPDFRSFYDPTDKHPPPVDHPDTYKPSAIGEVGYMEETAAHAARDAGDVLIFIEHTPLEIEQAVYYEAQGVAFFVDFSQATLVPRIWTAAHSGAIQTEGDHSHHFDGGDAETRPKTYSVNYFIKVNQ